MSLINIELKARTDKADFIRQYLLHNGAAFKGTDHQTDTYFNTPKGRLKLRQGNIENTLIYYERPDQSGPKQSDFQLMEIENGDALKAILSKSLGIKVVVDKKREIYYIRNVKFHIDSLQDLGNFVEIEASNAFQPLPLDQLHEQCNFYREAFQIHDEDLIQISYSDMLLNKVHGNLQQATTPV